MEKGEHLGGVTTASKDNEKAGRCTASTRVGSGGVRTWEDVYEAKLREEGLVRACDDKQRTLQREQ